MTLQEILQKLRDTKRGPIGLTGIMSLLNLANQAAERDEAQRAKWREEFGQAPYPGDMMGPGIGTVRTPFRVPMRVRSAVRDLPAGRHFELQDKDIPRFLEYKLRNRLGEDPFNVDVNFSLLPEEKRAYLSMLNSRAGSGAPGTATPAVSGTRFKGTKPENLEKALGRVAEDLAKAGYEEIRTSPISKGRYRLFERVMQKLRDTGAIPKEMRLKMSDPGESYEGPAVEKIRERKAAEAARSGESHGIGGAQATRRMRERYELPDIPNTDAELRNAFARLENEESGWNQMRTAGRASQAADPIASDLVDQMLSRRDEIPASFHRLYQTTPMTETEIGNFAREYGVWPDAVRQELRRRGHYVPQQGELRSPTASERASKERAATPQVMQEINALPEAEREAWMRVQNIDPSRVQDTLSPAAQRMFADRLAGRIGPPVTQEELVRHLRGIPAPPVDLNAPEFRRNAEMFSHELEPMPPQEEMALRQRFGLSGGTEPIPPGRPEDPGVASRRARYIRDLENEELLRARFERQVEPLNQFGAAASDVNALRTGNVYSPEYVQWLERRRMVEPEILDMYQERTRGRTR